MIDTKRMANRRIKKMWSVLTFADDLGEGHMVIFYTLFKLFCKSEIISKQKMKVKIGSLGTSLGVE